MSVPVTSGLTYDDLAAMPEPGVDGLRKELIDGELYKVCPAPMDVYFWERTVVEPDVVFLPVQRAAELDDTLTCPAAPGFELAVADVLA